MDLFSVVLKSIAAARYIYHTFAASESDQYCVKVDRRISFPIP